MPDRYFQLKMAGEQSWEVLYSSVCVLCVCFYMPLFELMSSDNSYIPPSLNALRACKLCKLIKSYDQVDCRIAILMIVPSQWVRKLSWYSTYGWRWREGAGIDVSLLWRVGFCCIYFIHIAWCQLWIEITVGLHPGFKRVRSVSGRWCV